MAETAGSVGMVGFRRNPGINPNVPSGRGDVIDDLAAVYEKRQIVKQELRRKELEEKGERGELNNREAMELAAYNVENALERIAKLGSSTVCYMA